MINDTENEYIGRVTMGRSKTRNPETQLSTAQQIDRLEKNIHAYKYRVDLWEKQLKELKAKL